MTVFYLDYVNGSDANDGSSWALAWKTITSGATAARIAPGDIIRIAKSPDPTSLGMTATWTDLSRAVVLDSALTANVYLCEAAWTASASVTCTTSTTRKEGSFSSSINVAGIFTTGKVAYRALGATIDYSGYEQISFWIRTTAPIAPNTLKLSLCSDATGDVIVDDFVIPTLPGTANRWTVFTINKGAALGASIQSVALYALLDPGALIILIDNIIACKAVGSADSLSLTSLISKNSLAQGGTEGWYGIKSINGTAIELDNDTNSGAGAGRGYSGTTETVTTYKRETIKTALVATIAITVQECQDNGTLGNNIEYQGGYDTATTIQDGETFFDGSNGLGYGLQLSSKSYNTLNYLSFSRYYTGIRFYSSNNNTITTVTNANNNGYNGIDFSSNSNNNTITTVTNANNNSSYGLNLGSSNNNIITTITNVNNNNSIGIYLTYWCNCTITTITNVNNNINYGLGVTGCSNTMITTVTNANNNSIYGIYFTDSYNNTIGSLSTTGNPTAGISNNRGSNYVNKAVIAEVTKVSGMSDFANSRIFAHNFNNTVDNHWIFTDGGTINAQTAVRHTASGIAWLLKPTSANRSTTYPLDLTIAKIAVSANNLVTAKAWFRRSHTSLTMSLVCKGGQIDGVPNDVISSMTAIANTWEELTIQFTPTEVGVVEIQAWAYGGTAYSGYVDDMSITQA